MGIVGMAAVKRGHGAATVSCVYVTAAIFTMAIITGIRACVFVSHAL